MKIGLDRQLDPNKRSGDAERFEKALRRKVVGQDAAVEKVCEIYQMFLAGLNPPGRPVGNLLFLGPTGTGKCLAPGTLVLMYDGTVKPVEQIRVGDLLIGPDSKPRCVLSLAHGWDEMYDIIPVKGDSYRVNKPHILSLQLTPSRPGQKIETINIPVKDYLNKNKTFKHRAKGWRTGVDFAEQPLPVEPYFFGLWLGDGTSKWAEVTSDDIEIIECVYTTAAAAGMEVSMYDERADKPTRYNINTGTKGRRTQRPKNPVLEALRGLGVLENKHIPLVYKANSHENRLKLLAGIFDSDGHPTVENCDFVSKNKQLAEDVAYIARSVGLAAYIRPCRKVCQTGNGGVYYRVSISGDLSQVPTRVARKIVPPRRQKKSVLRTGITVKSAGWGEYFGFELDGDGLFLLGDFTVTHNTRVIEAMAETLFGDPRALIKIDCAEFQHSHEIAKLIGSPPGYLGHRETHPLLTQEALNQWHTDKLKLSIVLFDEIEKASDALWQLLLGILDKAVLTLGDNRRVDLSQCLIVMTSNLGAKEMEAYAKDGMGFSVSKTIEEKLGDEYDAKIDRTASEAARKRFSPEFMNRIDKVVVFKTLRPEHLKEILEIELGMVQQRVLMATGNNQFVFSCSDRVKEFLLKEGIDPKYGARHLKRTIEKHVVFPLSNLVASGQIKFGDSIKIDLDENGDWQFITESEGNMIPILLAKYGPEFATPTPRPISGGRKVDTGSLLTKRPVDEAKSHIDKANEHLERARRIAEELGKPAVKPVTRPEGENDPGKDEGGPTGRLTPAERAKRLADKLAKEDPFYRPPRRPRPGAKKP